MSGTMMKALVANAAGDLRVARVAIPTPGPGEVSYGCTLRRAIPPT
jgi:hypothetical protein